MLRIKAERLRLGMTQTEVAYLSKLTQSEVSRIERGYARPYPGQARRLALVLGCDPGNLTDEDLAVRQDGAGDVARRSVLDE